MSHRVQVVWFKRDLRIHDHAPLFQAAAAGPVLPVYVIEPEQWQTPDSALRHWQFAAESLRDLSQALAGINLPLCCWQGDILTLLEALKAHYGTFTLHAHQETGNAWSFSRDQRVSRWCRHHGISWHQPRQHGIVRGLKKRRRWEAQWETLMAAPRYPWSGAACLGHCQHHCVSALTFTPASITRCPTILTPKRATGRRSSIS